MGILLPSFGSADMLVDLPGNMEALDSYFVIRNPRWYWGWSKFANFRNPGFSTDRKDTLEGYFEEPLTERTAP